MKSKFLRILALILVMASMLSMFAIFASAEENAETGTEGTEGEEDTFNLMYHRTFNEGWDMLQSQELNNTYSYIAQSFTILMVILQKCGHLYLYKKQE